MDPDIEGMQAGPSRKKLEITRKELFFSLKDNNMLKLSSAKCVQHLIDYLATKLLEDNISTSFEPSNFEHCTLKIFVIKLLLRWKMSNYYLPMFLNKNSTWLNQHIKLPDHELGERSLDKSVAHISKIDANLVSFASELGLSYHGNAIVKPRNDMNVTPNISSL